MPTLLLLRHGETHWNRERRFQGHGDSPLTLVGLRQAEAYGHLLLDLVGRGDGWQVVASPAPRCLQTAAILCEIAGLPFSQVQTDERLREISVGTWTGRLKSEIDPALLSGKGTQSWVFRCPGGETHAQIVARLSSWLSERATGERLIVVGHGLTGRVLRGLYAKETPDSALAGDSPQDAVFRLSGGAVERLPTGVGLAP